MGFSQATEGFKRNWLTVVEEQGAFNRHPLL